MVWSRSFRIDCIASFVSLVFHITVRNFHQLGRGARIVHNEDPPRERLRMARAIIAVPYLVAMIAVIVTVDALIFRNHFWERLMVNIGIVLVFAAFYLRFLKQP
jgi:hypothetical protein